MRLPVPALLAITSLTVGGVLVLKFGTALAGDAPVAAASGHCDFKLKNQWVGPLKACAAPSTAAACTELGKKDENSDAVWTEGNCPTAGLVGVCKRADNSMHYYEGEASGLEVGCGFQSGEWSTPAK